ncbi:glycine rich domain-containing protein [Hymenobacter ginkgonis]|nr:glycine rich domain-containing protein [Hymenobacter ginkgonis]
MSQPQRDAIASPANGLTIYNTSTNALNTWNGTSWTEAITSATQPIVQNTATTFVYTGGVQTYTVPAGMYSLGINASGAQGGANYDGTPGGLGGRVATTLAVTPGETLTLYVGGQGGMGPNPGSGGAGYNGGGQGSSFNGGGGGATDVRVGGTTLAERVLVAAGGGGGGPYTYKANNARGGAGGSPSARPAFSPRVAPVAAAGPPRPPVPPWARVVTPRTIMRAAARAAGATTAAGRAASAGVRAAAPGRRPA